MGKSNLPVNNRLTQARLMEVARYDSKTGEFFNLRKGGESLVCKASNRGYFRFTIDGQLYQVHRLAWLYVFGEFPSNLIDHINGKKTDNRICNLRACTYMDNVQNVSGKARCKSGLRGAYEKSGGRWEAKIGVNYKTISLGHFRSADEAHRAYLEGKKKYHSFSPIFRE